MRALTAQQMLTIWESNRTRAPLQRALALLFESCPESSVESLTELSIGQRDGRLLRLREWAFGSEVAALADCPECGARLEMSFTVEDIAEAENESSEPLSFVFEDFEISFRRLNGLDLAAAAASGSDMNAARRTLLERSVLRTNFRGTETAVAEAPQSVIAELSRRMMEADPQADVRLALECASCGHQWRAAFDIVFFFWSEIDAWARRLLRDVHILASSYGWRETDILGLSPLRRQTYLEMLSA